MNIFPDKTKHLLVLIIKFLIIGMAFYYIHQHLKLKKQTHFSLIFSSLSLLQVALIFLFSILNWSMEVLKWKNLILSIKKITFGESLEQTLGSLTASIFTPNRIGEYGAKALYFKTTEIKDVLLLNFVSNSSQMSVTLLFGLIGLTLFPLKELSFFHVFILVFSFVLLITLLRKINFIKKTFTSLIHKFKKIPFSTIQMSLFFSMVRYLIFSHQFYFLLISLNCDIDYSTALALIFIMYLASSIIPSIQIIDVTIKGSVSLFLFSKLNIEDEKILSIVFIMWFFNLVVPSIMGSYFVLKFKPQIK